MTPMTDEGGKERRRGFEIEESRENDQHRTTALGATAM